MSINIELDNTLTQLELMNEKAKVMCDEIKEDYFGLQDLELIQYFCESTKIKNDIVLDYLDQIEDKIQKLRTLME